MSSSITIRSILRHERFCDQMLECSACGFVIPASTKSIHDKWECSRKNLQTFCRTCHASFGHSHIEKHKRNCMPVAVDLPEEPRPVLASSRPITIGRPISESDHECVVSPAFGSLDSASSLLQDSGSRSLSSSSDSDHGASSITWFEMSALCKAIEAIHVPGVDTSRENMDEIRMERSEGETQRTACDFCIWNERRVNPTSRTFLNRFNAIFFTPKTDGSP